MSLHPLLRESRIAMACSLLRRPFHPLGSLVPPVRFKTTRPQEWKDRSRFAVKIHPDQVPPLEDPQSKGHKWMDVRWKNKNSAETLIHSLAIDESRRSDAREAQSISDQKLRALKNSLTTRG